MTCEMSTFTKPDNFVRYFLSVRDLILFTTRPAQQFSSEAYIVLFVHILCVLQFRSDMFSISMKPFMSQDFSGEDNILLFTVTT